MNYFLTIFTFVFILFGNVSLQSNRLSFDQACADFIDNEILFFGKCTFNKDPYSRLYELTEHVLKSDPNTNLHEFIRNDLAKNSTFYFRTRYFNETEYLTILDDFELELLKVVDELKDSLTTVKVEDFFLAAKKSNFTAVLKDVIDWRLSLLAIDFELFSQLFCYRDFINLCSRTSLLIPIKNTEILTDKNVFDFLSFVFNTAFDNLKNPLLKPNSTFVQNKLKKINTQGTRSTLLGEVHEIMETDFFKSILEFYSEFTTTSTRRTKTSTTTKTSTRRIKVIAEKAVETSIIYAIGFGVLSIGIVASIAIIFFEIRYGNRQTVNDIQMQEVKY